MKPSVSPATLLGGGESDQECSPVGDCDKVVRKNGAKECSYRGT